MADQNQDSSREQPKFKVDGVDGELTLDELKAGYLRQQDYTKKTQELSEERDYYSDLARVDQLLAADPQKAKQVRDIIDGKTTTSRAYAQVEDLADDDSGDKKANALLAQMQERMADLEKQLQSTRQESAVDRIRREVKEACGKYSLANADYVTAVASLPQNARLSVEDIAKKEHDRQQSIIDEHLKSKAPAEPTPEPEKPEPVGLGQGLPPGEVEKPAKKEVSTRPMDMLRDASKGLLAAIRAKKE